MKIVKFLAATVALAVAQISPADESRGVNVSHHETLQDFTFSQSSARGALSVPASGTAVLNFSALGRRFELRLESNDRLLSSSARSNLADGVRLYKGRIAGNDESWVRIVMYDDAPRGLIWNGSELLAVEAPGDSEIATTGPVIYRLADTYVSGALTCGVAASSDNGAAAYAALVGELETAAAAAPGAVSQLNLGAIGDFEFTSSNGGAAAAAAAIMTRMNNVDGIYSAQVGVQIATTVETHPNASDPFTDATDASVLLDEVGQYRSNTPEQTSLGLTHLFTGRNLDGSPVGLGYISRLCSARFGAGLTQATNGSTTDSLVAAHEIGHNFGAPHDGEPGSACESEPTTFLMAPSLNGNDQFSQCSLDRMSIQVSSVSCILPLPGVDVTVAAVGAPPAPLLGNSATVNFDVSNTGTDPATSVAADITLPGNVTFLSAAAVPGSCTSGAGVVNCAFGTLSGGASSNVTISTISAAVGSGTFDAVVTADVDDNTANNEASIAITVDPAVDLGFSTPGSTQLPLDRNTTVTVSMANNSILDASGVTLSATVDAGLRIDSVSFSIGNCTVAGQRIDCTASLFANQDSATLTFDVTGIAAGRQDYSVSLSSTEADRNPADNNASGSVTVNAPGGNDGNEESGGASGAVFLTLLLWALLRRRTAIV